MIVTLHRSYLPLLAGEVSELQMNVTVRQRTEKCLTEKKKLIHTSTKQLALSIMNFKIRECLK